MGILIQNGTIVNADSQQRPVVLIEGELITQVGAPFCFTDQKSPGTGDFTRIPNGGPGVENRLQILWGFGINAGRLTPERFVEICCTAPAPIFGMPQKGAIAFGKDADGVLWDPKADYTISAGTQAMATDYSMFEGWKVRGNARYVFSRGDLVVKDGMWIGEVGRGRFVKREANAGGWIESRAA